VQLPQNRPVKTRSLATVAIVLLILVAGVVLLYAVRAQTPPPAASLPIASATAAASVATSPSASAASAVVSVCGALNAYQAASGTRNAVLSMVLPTGQTNFELSGTGSVPANLGRDSARPEILKLSGRRVAGGNAVAEFSVVRVSSCGPGFAAGDTPLPGADRFAVIVDKPCNPPGSPPTVVREDETEVIAALGNGYLCQLNGAVSPDGRRLAYWQFESIGARSEIALYQGGASTTLVRLGDEFLSNLVWSADGTGLLFVAMKGGVQGVPPEYAALRTLDLASGSIVELTRVTGRFLTALAWDREKRVTAATETLTPGGAGAYLVITEARVITRNETSPGLNLVRASPDATLMMALAPSGSAIRYWPLASFGDQKELRPAAGSAAGIAVWRPGAREIAVVVTTPPGVQAVELWALDGTRRRLLEFSGQRGGLFFRPDGSALFIGGGTGIDIATGRASRFTFEHGEGLTASLFR
jgi:hypothetical protein